MIWTELRTACKRQSDYIITLFVTNELSLGLTWLLSGTRITPNQVTAASIATGLGCALAYAFGHFWLGSLLLFLSHIFDCTDGNLARAKSEFSPIGKWLDMTGDRIAEAAIFIGAAFFLIRTAASEFWILISLLDATFLLIYYYIVDISLAMGLAEPVQHIGGLNFKGVHVKWGLLEPVIYGFIVLAPLGLIKVQLTIVLIISLGGISFQIFKRLKAFRATEAYSRSVSD